MADKTQRRQQAQEKLPLTNYNIFALQGADVDDMDVVEDLGLDPQVAYTPLINDAAVEKMYQENLQAYQEHGYTRKEAEKMAGFHRDAAKAAVKAAMADQRGQFQS